MILDKSIRDEIADRLNRIAVPAYLGSLLIMSLFIIVFGKGQYHRLLPALLAMITITPAWLLTKKGQPFIGIVFVIVAVCLSILSGMIVSGGIRAPAYVATLSLAPIFVILYGSRGGIWFAITTILVGALFISLDNLGLLAQVESPPPLLYLLLYSIYLALQIVVVSLPVGLLHGAFVKLWKREQSLLDTNNKLQEEIGQRVKAEALLRESEERYRSLTSNIPVGLFRASNRGNILSYNKSIQELLDIPESLLDSKKVNALSFYTDRADRERFEEEMKQKGEVKGFESQVKTFGGQLIWVSITARRMPDERGRGIFVDGVIEDITKRKLVELDKEKLQVQLMQSQKMQAVGTLAAGIAHDFNNLLMGIQGRSFLVAFNLPPADPNTIHLREIDEYIQSAINLTKQLLGTGQEGKYNPTPIDLRELLNESSKMFGRTRKEMQINVAVPPQIVVARVDKQQLEQVLLNMYVNAWHAMPNGGDLYIKVDMVRLDDVDCEPHNVESGKYAKISITDSGIGMDQSILTRVFDPFFTTKDTDRGTGLGLSSAYGIIKNHGGFITVYSEVNHGSTFNLYLPLSFEEPVRHKTVDEEIVSGTGTILVVDDEEMILEVGKELLEELGYTVFTSNRGHDAIAILISHNKLIDLIILDMIMPGMDGGRTFKIIRELYPSIPVILSSGYSKNDQISDIMEHGCEDFIQKPFRICELSQKIYKLLRS